MAAVLEKLGKSQEAFARKVAAKRQELERLGQLRPFTVLNFNPVELRLEGMLQQYKIPAPTDKRLPNDVSRHKVPFAGKEWLCHALVIRQPKFYGRTTNVGTGGAPGEDIPERELEWLLPIGIAYSFLEHFSPIFVTEEDGMAAPPPKDQRTMYGVLAFEGDVHTLSQKNLEKNDYKINVPIAEVIENGNRIYRTVPYDLETYLERCFSGQRQYCDVLLTQAQQKASEGPEGVKEIGSDQRVWCQWALDNGVLAKEKTPRWMNRLLTLTEETPGRPQLRKCQSCRATEPEMDTPFCPQCGSPVDAYATFMAGHPVPEAYLMALRGEQRTAVLKELKERRKGFEDFSGAGAPRGSYKGKDAKGKTDAAESDEQDGFKGDDAH